MPEVTHKLAEVFGISRNLPLNYVERSNVDTIFTNSLKRDKHLVIYGSSKQGKTSLRKKWLTDDDHIVVSCTNTMSVADLNGAILKKTGYKVEQSDSRTITGQWKVTAEFKGKGKVPFIAAAEGSAGGELGKGNDTEIVRTRLELDLQDVNDVIAALQEIKFSQYIVLEDFHYLPVETQKNFSFALKSYHENSSICFIIIGVWREKNRLVYYNGDLTSRVVAIDADFWSKEQLDEVISAGEQLLNITFDTDFAEQVINNAFNSVYLVQEACLMACERAGITETRDDNVVIGKDLDAKSIIKEIVDNQAGRYLSFITNFAEGFRKTGLEMYKWLIFAVISADYNELATGLRRSIVATVIKQRHPSNKELNDGNITLALQNTASLQVLKNVRPIILDYDQTTRVLNVVDRSFLIWLAYQNSADLILEIEQREAVNQQDVSLVS